MEDLLGDAGFVINLVFCQPRDEEVGQNHTTGRFHMVGLLPVKVSGVVDG